MKLSIFLAQFFGLYLLIIGIFYIAQQELIKKMATEFFNNPSLIVFGGIINLIIGLLVVLSHNIWIWDWPLAITLLGYLILLKGVARLFLPTKNFKKWFGKSSKGHNLIYSALICLIIGAFLTYEGFIA